MNKAIEKISRFYKFGSVLGLERMQELMEKLGNPHEELKVIHVAGTNGKGSVCKYIYEVLQAGGYRTGLFISPFVEDFNERIQFDGAYITDEELIKYTDTVIEKADEMVSEGHDSPTEFEVTTAIAILYFKEKGADFAILEVGLGGRGDSTNIIESPLVSVITSISYDHMNVLGSTLTEIAGEKAGIIKPGIPVIANVDEREAAVVIAKKAYELGCVFRDASKIKARGVQEMIDGCRCNVELDGIEFSNLRTSMGGSHQIENLITALMALEYLRKSGYITYEMEQLYEGLKNARQPARLEILDDEPYVLLDGAHNKAGAEALACAVLNQFAGHKILMAVGMLEDKDIDSCLDFYTKITDEFIAAEPDNPRRLPAGEMKKKLEDRNVNCLCESSAKDLASVIFDKKKDYDVVVVAGSLYLAGDFRRLYRDEKQKEQGTSGI